MTAIPFDFSAFTGFIATTLQGYIVGMMPNLMMIFVVVSIPWLLLFFVNTVRANAAEVRFGGSNISAPKLKGEAVQGLELQGNTLHHRNAQGVSSTFRYGKKGKE